MGQAPVECASLSPAVNSTGQGDEVIASTLTFIGSVTPAIFQGAELTFVDCDRESWNMDPDLLKEALEDCEKRGKLPKAVVPTDLYGQCVDYERILKICEAYGVPVVADAAESLGAKYLTPGAKAQNNIEKKTYPCRVVGGEVAEDLFKRGLCLPSGTAMTKGDLDRAIDTILSCRFR